MYITKNKINLYMNIKSKMFKNFNNYLIYNYIYIKEIFKDNIKELF